MGIKLKPIKCRSLSIQKGKPSVVHYKIGEHKIPSIKEEEQKFLRKILFFNGKQSETYNYVKQEIEKKILNINKTEIRNEFKMWIYHHYLLPSIRFILTIHALTKTDLTKLDNMCHKHLKVWAGLPRCATNSIFHHQKSLNITSISDLYREAHCLNYANIKLKGDDLVNHALDNKVEREEKFQRKKSVYVEARKTFQERVEENTENEPEEGKTSHKYRKKIKNLVKTKINNEKLETHINHVHNLVQQGNLLRVAGEEEQDLTWKYFAYGLKKGTLKFVLNATLDTLPTKANLLKWKKCTSDKCKLCGAKETLLHVLSGCPVSLRQSRYTWRHDGIVNYIASTIDTSKYTIYADIDRFRTNSGGTIPPKALITTDRPDLVIIDEETKSIHIFELTVPHISNIQKRHEEKTNKYKYLESECEDYKIKTEAFEVEIRGHITKENKKSLKQLFSFCSKNISIKLFYENIAKMAINGSYYIYLCRNQTVWADLPLLKA